MSPNRRHLRTFLREAAATTVAAAFLIGLMFVGNMFGQVS